MLRRVSSIGSEKPWLKGEFPISTLAQAREITRPPGALLKLCPA